MEFECIIRELGMRLRRRRKVERRRGQMVTRRSYERLIRLRSQSEKLLCQICSHRYVQKSSKLPRLTQLFYKSPDLSDGILHRPLPCLPSTLSRCIRFLKCTSKSSTTFPGVAVYSFPGQSLHLILGAKTNFTPSGGSAPGSSCSFSFAPVAMLTAYGRMIGSKSDSGCVWRRVEMAVRSHGGGGGCWFRRTGAVSDLSDQLKGVLWSTYW